MFHPMPFYLQAAAGTWQQPVYLYDYTGCEITGFPAFRDTQKHCRKAKFLTRISEWKARKNQVFGKIDSRFQFGKPERFSESQFFGVAFQMETQNVFVISHPVIDHLEKDIPHSVISLHHLWNCAYFNRTALCSVLVLFYTQVKVSFYKYNIPIKMHVSYLESES